LGRATEITRDEVKFSKFIMRLRSKFSSLFLKLLERQLILKGICTSEDWKKWQYQIDFKFAVDNYFSEMKQMEMLRDRLGLLRDMDEYIGKYYSHEYVRRFVLQQTETDVKELDKEIASEKRDPRYLDPEEQEQFGLSTAGPMSGGEPPEREQPQSRPEPEREDDREQENDQDE